MDSPERRSGTRLPSNPLHWTETQLGAFLQSRGLPKSTASAFEDHLVNGLVAVDLSHEDLALMGICDDFQQRRLLLELRQLFKGGDVELLSKIETFLPEVQPQVPPAQAKRPEKSKARPTSPYLHAFARSKEPGEARRPKQKRSEEMTCFSPEQQATAAAASLAGGLHASDVQAAIIAALPGALESLLVPKHQPLVPPAPKHVPQKPSPRSGARRPGTGQARWQATQGVDRCRPASGGEARPFEESATSQIGRNDEVAAENGEPTADSATFQIECNDEVAAENGEPTADTEEEARALVPLLKNVNLSEDAYHQEPSTSTRVEELEAHLQAMQASLQEAAQERLELKRQLQNSTDRSEALESQLGSTQRQFDELLKELRDANEKNEQHNKTMESLRTELLAQQQQLQQQQLQLQQQEQQQVHQQSNHQQPEVREASSQCSLLALTPSTDTKAERFDSCSSPIQPPALPPRPRRDEAAWSVGSSSGAEAVVGNLTSAFEAAWQAPAPDMGGLAVRHSSSQRQLDQICDEFRLQVRDLVSTRPLRPQCAAAIAEAIETRRSATGYKTAKVEEESFEQVPIRIAASHEDSFPELDAQFVDATVAELADSAVANAE